MSFDRDRVISYGFAALYGLAVLALAFLCLFLLMGLYRALVIMLLHFSDLSKQELMLTTLALLGMVLIGFLILMFLHALLVRNAAQIGTRSAIVIVMISTVALLQKVLDISNQNADQLFWSISLHGILVLTAIIVFVFERLNGRDSAQAQKFIR